MRGLVERNRTAEACEIAFHLLFFWLIRGHAAEGLRWYERFASVESLSPSARAQALAGEGVMLYALGDLDRAVDVCARSLSVSGDVTTIAAAVAENILGH